MMLGRLLIVIKLYLPIATNTSQDQSRNSQECSEVSSERSNQREISVDLSATEEKCRVQSESRVNLLTVSSKPAS